MNILHWFLWEEQIKEQQMRLEKDFGLQMLTEDTVRLGRFISRLVQR